MSASVQHDEQCSSLHAEGLKSKWANEFIRLGLVRNGISWRGLVNTVMNFGLYKSLNCREHQFLSANGSVN